MREELKRIHKRMNYYFSPQSAVSHQLNECRTDLQRLCIHILSFAYGLLLAILGNIEHFINSKLREANIQFKRRQTFFYGKGIDAESESFRPPTTVDAFVNST